jgi:arylformamidase
MTSQPDMDAPSRFIDLSHEIADGMPVLPGLPTPRIGPYLDHDQSRSNYDDAEFFLGKVDMPANIGTYIDAPFHRFRDREDLSQIPLGRIVGLTAVLVEVRDIGTRAVQPVLPDVDLSGAAVLVRSGWESHWGTEAYWGPRLI